ncbi:hypothetical protein MIZ03_2239 [Rhodoferax lithotrophicus]|uniref:Uncharacterized protein n=1 Tax=Rhodoferax lithotrophicus TaxID=2798804 RepID=A0ABN6D8Z0_9BURK|nr:hypothetical protein [Rhodoferax sp. MIZ03]BCO27351.1 hypothetical protein MIZ03_2239 [Rhodoferax sp. MIZ03]
MKFLTHQSHQEMRHHAMRIRDDLQLTWKEISKAMGVTLGIALA